MTPDCRSGEQPLDLLLAENRRDPLGSFSTDGLDREVERITVEDMPVEEEDRAERLILGGSGHIAPPAPAHLSLSDGACH
jgi:hypothetical protein